ncbi:hypothetical protein CAUPRSCDRAFT_12806 [Caulochytrium protostelioides]|uniref:Uncharacterized protein n=1 Tax=Caulochytrium protostelioides TaxID=1555241 RepID=A0A4P9WS83_9FUNG|nr:hypothetical protein CAUPRSCDRAFT_12806 [Caulochytrium protostelioides]
MTTLWEATTFQYGVHHVASIKPGRHASFSRMFPTLLPLAIIQSPATAAGTNFNACELVHGLMILHPAKQRVGFVSPGLPPAWLESPLATEGPEQIVWLDHIYLFAVLDVHGQLALHGPTLERIMVIPSPGKLRRFHVQYHQGGAHLICHDETQIGERRSLEKLWRSPTYLEGEPQSHLVGALQNED